MATSDGIQPIICQGRHRAPAEKELRDQVQEGLPASSRRSKKDFDRRSDADDGWNRKEVASLSLSRQLLVGWLKFVIIKLRPCLARKRYS